MCILQITPYYDRKTVWLRWFLSHVLNMNEICSGCSFDPVVYSYYYINQGLHLYRVQAKKIIKYQRNIFRCCLCDMGEQLKQILQRAPNHTESMQVSGPQPSTRSYSNLHALQGGAPSRSLSPTNPNFLNVPGARTIPNAQASTGYVINNAPGSVSHLGVSRGQTVRPPQAVYSGSTAGGAIGVSRLAVPPQVVGGAAGVAVGAGPLKPNSSSRIEYVPFERTVTDYETRQVVTSMWVPVQRKCLNYYAIENITEYIPRQVDDVRYEMVPEEIVNYRVQYVPVDKQIVHFPHEEGYINHNQHSQYTRVGAIHGHETTVVGGATYSPQYYSGTNNFTAGLANRPAPSKTVNPANIPGYTPLASRGTLPKSNYVTSDGYVPSYLTNNYPAINMNTGYGGAGYSGSGAGYTSTNSPSPAYMGNQDFLQSLSAGFKNISNPNSGQQNTTVQSIAANVKQSKTAQQQPQTSGQFILDDFNYNPSGFNSGNNVRRTDSMGSDSNYKFY